MLTNLKQHLYPKSITEALEMLKDQNSMLLAGGTGLSLERNDVVQTLIDLQHVNLSYIRDEEEFFAIGAMTSAYAIHTHNTLPQSLRYAAYCVGDTPIMHGVTIGGNLAKFYNWVDLPPMLWALDASIVVYNPEKKVYSADEFFEYSKEENIYSRKELIAEIRIPLPVESSYSEFRTFMTTENEKAQLNLASYFEWDEELTLKEVRFIVNATTNFPVRLTALEEKVVGTKLDGIDLETVKSAVDELSMITSYKSSIEYRRHILGVYIRRAINACRDKMEAQ